MCVCYKALLLFELGKLLDQKYRNFGWDFPIRVILTKTIEAGDQVMSVGIGLYEVIVKFLNPPSPICSG